MQQRAARLHQRGLEGMGATPTSPTGNSRMRGQDVVMDACLRRHDNRVYLLNRNNSTNSPIHTAAQFGTVPDPRSSMEAHTGYC